MLGRGEVETSASQARLANPTQLVRKKREEEANKSKSTCSITNSEKGARCRMPTFVDDHSLKIGSSQPFDSARLLFIAENVA